MPGWSDQIASHDECLWNLSNYCLPWICGTIEKNHTHIYRRNYSYVLWNFLKVLHCVSQTFISHASILQTCVTTRDICSAFQYLWLLRQKLYCQLLRLVITVTVCEYLMPTRQFASYIIDRTSYFLMNRWWGPLCTRPTR